MDGGQYSTKREHEKLYIIIWNERYFEMMCYFEVLWYFVHS